MKKVIALVLSLILALSMVGCGQTDTNIENNEEIKNIEKNKWGVGLEATNATPSGLTIICHHEGGKEVAELTTGSFYNIQKKNGSEWEEVDYLPQEHDIGWTMEAWIINKNDTTSWDIDWAWLYGELPAGEYRIGKVITNFRDTGDYDTEIAYAEFEIK